MVPRKSAWAVAKTLKSAIANAQDLKANNPRYRALDTDNLLVPLRAALQAGCTIGECCGVLRDVWGEWDRMAGGH